LQTKYHGSNACDWSMPFIPICDDREARLRWENGHCTWMLRPTRPRFTLPRRAALCNLTIGFPSYRYCSIACVCAEGVVSSEGRFDILCTNTGRLASSRRDPGDLQVPDCQCRSPNPCIWLQHEWRGVKRLCLLEGTQSQAIEGCRGRGTKRSHCGFDSGPTGAALWASTI
jgi:hypothetical protein